MLQSFLWYSFYLLTIRRGIAENSRYTFFDEDISIEEKINNAISQNEFELIGQGSEGFPFWERKGGLPAFGWWGKSRFLYVRTRGNIAEALSYNLLMYRGGHIGKGNLFVKVYLWKNLEFKSCGLRIKRFSVICQGYVSTLIMWLSRG